MSQAILVTNIKGGTGKSTVAQALAYELRDQGHKTGVLDADIDSANLATRFGTSEKVSFEGDHTIKPVEHDGLKLFSMENAFEESSFSQSGEFMGEAVRSMINNSDWGELDYLVVDCPPGSSDVFEELVSCLRPNILGAVSVGISDAIDDTARLVKVCGHNWIPIIGFVENMSGLVCHGEEVTCDVEGETVAPFGKGNIKQFAENINGNFMGEIPLAADDADPRDVAPETVDNIVESIEEAPEPKLPEDNRGRKGFISSLWSSISDGIKRVNNEIPVDDIQDDFGVEGRDPIVMELELTDATGITTVLSKIILTVDGGRITPMRPGKAKRKGKSIEGGIKISSQNLSEAIKGEKKIMNAATGEIITEPYSITKAVQMGDAEVWGDRTINRLAVLDKIMSDVVDMNEVQKAMEA